MDGVFQSPLNIIFIVVFTIGNLGNGFLALVNCTDWVKRRKSSSVDHILTALAISRIVVLWTLLINIAIFSLYPTLLMTSKLIRIISLTLTVTIHFSFWLAASLSMFYFLKIANFSNSIFPFLKWRVKKVISVILLASLLFLFSNILLLKTRTDIWTDGYKNNMSSKSNSSDPREIYSRSLKLSSFFFSVPIAMSLTTFLFLIFSLWKHLKNMQLNATGLRDVGTTAHIKALQIMVFSVLLDIIFFLLLVIYHRTFELLEKCFFVSFVCVGGITIPSVHTYVLILGNSKLRQAFLSVLWYLTCSFKDEEASGP